ncbi:MAG: hypothetical protein GXO70_04825 [Acidobacteria bacterium]|nr:hypothetical protein [Acidobacteriota bacterium]
MRNSGVIFKAFFFIILVMSVTTLTVAGERSYHPKINPVSFQTPVANLWFSLVPGTEFTYRTVSSEGTEINIVQVTDQTKVVMGITTRVVWDRVWLKGILTEETFDWYAGDDEGNIWYFGEDSRVLQSGKVISRKGSWEAGVNGAEPGIIMKAHPAVGDRYRQEYLKGEAEDMGEVTGLKMSVTVHAGTFTGCLQTKDWTPLEPGTFEYKYYSTKVRGVVLETSSNGKKRNELISVRQLHS